ncbi:class I adenylate-forming enzyme family protein [Sulfobacillus harzensis]|uniref:Acyl--CoA ligase n=1 Tax=Sulfobacillus harzensis TaxID=2729629 RepID=A0A7Y0Q3J1_9FIRM|nr:class I adenylate-forming enzyme family protein [Sulfobacillus harzensis]NMP23612.1 acyl--CoA ligase [Sulfobacillus harzensis]
MTLPSDTRREKESQEDFLARLREKYEGRATMARMLKAAVERDPEKTALVDGTGRRLSYRQMGQDVAALAGGLRDHGIGTGDRVAVMMRSHVDYVLAYYALITRGLVIVPLNVRLAAPEVAYVLENSGARAVLGDPEFRPVVDEAVRINGTDIARFWTADDPAYRRLFEAKPEPWADVLEDTLAAIYYTSGTTGKPKGAMITHLNMTAVGQQNVEAWYFDDPEVVELEISPLFHVSFQEFGPTIHAVGGTLVVDNFSPERSLDLIEREGVNAFFAVPSMLILMRKPIKNGRAT